MHDLMKDYICKGTFTFGTDLSVPFDFVFQLPPTPKCKVLLKYESTKFEYDYMKVMQKVSENRLLECALDGQTDDGGKITCSKLYVDKTSFNFDKTRGISLYLELLPWDEVTILYPAVTNADNKQNVYLLTNLLFAGDEFVQRDQRRDRARSTIEINGIKLNFLRLLTFDETQQKLANSTLALVTTEVTSFTYLDIENELDQLIWPLCWLCTLGQHSFVSPLYSAIKLGDSWSRISYKPVKTYPFHRLDACVDFSHLGDHDFTRYLERCYSEYKKWANTLKLDVVIEYAVHASAARALDISYMLLCIAFECLADNGRTYIESKGVELPLPSFEQNIKTLQQFMKSHDFKVSDEELRKLARSVSYNQPSLKEKLVAIFNDFNVKYADDDLEFLNIRNTLVHTGMFPKDVDSYKDTQRLKDFYDRVILTILGYKGGRRIVRSENFQRTALD
jgi:hypothetical protein